MAFTLGKFVRHTPAPALRSYFHRTNVDFGRAVDWTKGERTLAKALTIAIGRLPDVIREGVYADFERIDELADEIGEQAIISAFPDPAVAIELFDGMQGAHERCLWVLLNHDEVFRRAEDVRFSTHHRLSRMWDGFKVIGHWQSSRVGCSGCSNAVTVPDGRSWSRYSAAGRMPTTMPATS